MKNVKKILLSVAFSCVVMSHAATISVNIGEGTLQRANMSSGDYAGAPDVRTNNWNNLISMNNATLLGADAVYADGSTVGGTFQVVLTTPRNLSLGTTALTNDARMYYGGNEIRNGEANSLALTGIPFARYDIYVYIGYSLATRGGSVTVGSDTFYNRGIANPANDGTGYVLATSTAYNPDDPSAVAQGNYIKFEELSGSSQTINTAALYMGDATTHRYKIVGLQIVETIPEPATIGMLVIGALTTVMYRCYIRK